MLIKTEKFIFGNFAKITFICVSGLCRIAWKYLTAAKLLV